MHSTSSLKLSLKLAWPISLQQVLMTVLGMVDVMMVGHLGNEAVAAVGLGNRVQFVILVIFAGMGTALSILTAQYWGAKNIKGIRNSVVLAMVTGLVLLIPVVSLLYAFADDIIAWGSTDAVVIALGAEYIRLTLPALVLGQMLMVFEASLRSVGQVKTPLAISAIAMLANIGLNAIFIFGAGPIPAMGVAGAAIATSLARLLHLLMLVSFLLIKKHMIVPRLENFEVLNMPASWRRYLTISLPMMLNFGVWSSGTFVYAILYGSLGTEALAVTSLLVPIDGILISTFFGLSSASAIMVGHQLGANNHQLAWQFAKNFALFNPLVALGLGVLMYLNRDLILMPFSGLGASTLEQAAEILVLITMLSWLKVTNMTLSMGVLRTGGQNKYCLLIDTFGMWCVGIPLTYFGVTQGWSLFWVFTMMYAEEVTKATLFVRRLLQKTWMVTIYDPDHQIEKTA